MTSRGTKSGFVCYFLQCRIWAVAKTDGAVCKGGSFAEWFDCLLSSCDIDVCNVADEVKSEIVGLRLAEDVVGCSLPALEFHSILRRGEHERFIMPLSGCPFNIMYIGARAPSMAGSCVQMDRQMRQCSDGSFAQRLKRMQRLTFLIAQEEAISGIEKTYHLLVD